jgi:hypothetical protein
MPVAVPNAKARCDLETPHAVAMEFNVSECSELRSITHTVLSAIDMVVSFDDVLLRRLLADEMGHLIGRPVMPWRADHQERPAAPR